MKLSRRFLTGSTAVLLLLLIVAQNSFAQTYVDVTPGFSTLNDAITNNTNPNVIFRLQRGTNAIYLLNGSLNINSVVRIEAAAGTGARPQLIPAIGSGGVSDIPLRVKADLYLKGVYVTAKDEGGAYLSQILRVQADGCKMKFEDCFFENTAQSIIRTDNKNAKIFLLGSTFKNAASDWANGRGIDDRGVNIDTLFVENSTIYNIGFRFLRDGGGYIKYAYFNHNTFANIGIGLVDIGECPKFVFKNNLVSNCGFIGQGKKSGTGFLVYLKPLTSTDFAGVTQTAEVHHNNFYADPLWTKNFSDTVVFVPNYNSTLQAFVDAAGTGNTIITDAVSFTTATSYADLITKYWADPLKSSSTTATELRSTTNFDFGYAKTLKSYTFGSSNQPLGALTWFGLTVGVNSREELPLQYELAQNYPNPFNPSTIINYQIPENSNVTLKVYDVLGKEVMTLVNDFQSAGKYSVKMNSTAQNLTSGIYFYTIKTNNFIQTKKMMLVK
jgi:hypothetical protein